MAELFGLLDSLDIEPIGALEIDLSDVVQYREVGQTRSDDESTPIGELDLRSESESSLQPSQPETRANPETNPPNPSTDLSVELRDSVRYCFVDSPDDDAFVTGLLNKDTPVARALLGLAIGQEREVALPMGKRRIRVLEIHKPRPRNF